MQTYEFQTIMTSTVGVPTLGQFLRLQRIKLGLTQQDVAVRLAQYGLQFNRTSVTHWERGRFMPPIDDPKFVRTLAEILEVTEEEIMQAAGFNRESTGTAYALTPRPRVVAPSVPAGGAACPSLSMTCPQLSCPQAYACLAAGNRSLDRDNDGRPCETQCGGP